MDQLLSAQIKRNKILFKKFFECEKKLTNISLKASKPYQNYKINEKECLYNYQQILEMTDGSMAKILGEKYKEVDKYKIRARMPLPPYLFVSRITKIDAEFCEIKAGSSIEAEYDVPFDHLMSVNRKTLATVVFSEAAHIGIFLAGYMGIDVYASGKVKFRITDVTTAYVSEKWPCCGDTIKMNFTIDKLIKNGEIVLLIYSYKVYMDNELIIEAKETGGFFTQQTLDQGSGIKENVLKATNYEKQNNQIVNSFYRPITTKHSFDKTEVYNFLKGDYIKCFGNNVVNSNTHYKVCNEAMFVDEITELSSVGGKYGLGYIVAKKEIESSHWAFKCHFKNDPVLPGTTLLEGINQTSMFFQTCMGLYNTKNPFITRLKTGYKIQTSFRREVKCDSHTITYKLHPKIVQKVDNGLLFVTDSEVYCDGLKIIEQKNAAVIISENS